MTELLRWFNAMMQAGPQHPARCCRKTENKDRSLFAVTLAAEWDFLWNQVQGTYEDFSCLLSSVQVPPWEPQQDLPGSVPRPDPLRNPG